MPLFFWATLIARFRPPFSGEDRGQAPHNKLSLRAPTSSLCNFERCEIIHRRCQPIRRCNIRSSYGIRLGPCCNSQLHPCYLPAERSATKPLPPIATLFPVAASFPTPLTPVSPRR